MKNLRAFPLLLLLLTTSIVGIFSLYFGQEKEAVTARWLKQTQLIINHQVLELESELLHVIRDLKFVGDVVRNADWDNMDETLAPTLESFSRRQHFYDQIRYLDVSGQEKLRINFRNGSAEFVPKDKLQNKQHRYYFQESIQLSENDIYVSPFDLNMENRSIELPPKPVIRFAIPIMNDRGDKQGVVILNYLGEQLIERVAKLDQELRSKTILINARGEYLTAFEPEKSWGFMFQGRENEQFHSEYSVLWQQLGKAAFGQEVTAQGDIYTYGRVLITQFNDKDLCESCSLYIVNRLTAQQVEQLVYESLGLAPESLVIIYILLFGLCGAALWHVRRYYQASQALKALNQDISRERDLFADGPAVLFRWRNEFGWPVEHVSSNLKEVLGYREEQFLSGELGFASVVVPEDLPRITEELTDALQSEKDRFYRSPYRVIDAAGETRWVRDAIRVFRNATDHSVELYSYLMDIDALKQAEAELESSRSYIQDLLDTIPDPTLVIDINTYEVVSANEAAERTYLAEGQKVKGLTCYQLSHKTDKPCSGRDEPCPIVSVCNSKKASSVVHKHYDAKGLPFYVEVLASPMLNEEGEVIRILESHRDITQYMESQEVLMHKALTDSLTGISNRAGFERCLELEVDKVKTSGGNLGIVMFDLDHFKRVNDTFGHQVGDQVLIETASIVRKSIRSYDFFARWGGEEFMILLPRSDLAAVEHVAETLRKLIDQHHYEGVDTVTISLGVTCWVADDGEHIERFVERADKALYQSKNSGRNRVTVLAG